MPETLAPAGERVHVQYVVTRKGLALAGILGRMRDEAHQNQRILGARFVRRIDELYQFA